MDVAYYFEFNSNKSFENEKNIDYKQQTEFISKYDL